jgi:DNA-directed RNA polymerase subunit RPC12/RpoP
MIDMDGIFGLDKADGTRKCKCGKKKIKAEEKHLAIWHPRGEFSPKRDNYCKQCAVKVLIKIKDEIFKIEEILYGPESG